MIKAIIFDCFGVLVRDAFASMIEAVEPGKRPEVIELMHAAHHGVVSTKSAHQLVASAMGLDMDDYYRLLSESEVKNHELMEYILELKRDYKTAILSNIASGSLAKRFSKEELDSHFDAVIASGDVGYAKPEPEIYELAADRLGVRLDECIFTDDNEEFCAAARNVGMKAFRFEGVAGFKSKLRELVA
jgi:HAD superfamily hydrolase (TIGR01509 family)